MEDRKRGRKIIILERDRERENEREREVERVRQIERQKYRERTVRIVFGK